MEALDRLREGFFMPTNQGDHTDLCKASLNAQLLAKDIKIEMNTECIPRKKTTLNKTSDQPMEFWPAYVWKCNDCQTIFYGYETPFSYCPYCGMKVVSESDDHVLETFSKPIYDPSFNEDDIEHPYHYTQGPVECIEAIQAVTGDEYPAYLRGNIIKYLWRYPDKGGVDDLRKANVYLNWLIDFYEDDK